MRILFLSSVLFAFIGFAPRVRADSRPFTAKELAQGYRDGVVLAKPRPELVPTIDASERSEGMIVSARYPRFGNVGVLRLSPGESVSDAIRRLKATGRYLYVERDVIRHEATVPNDPSFINQWGLANTGANAGGGGIAGDDIHAEAAWGALTSASGIVVGILDSGALLNHEDLAANLWVNPSPKTSASYSNGFGENVTEVDALNGLNSVNGSGDPEDDDGHGTHVSGIVGAVGNNGVGVSGVAWSVQLMELKFIDATGNGDTTNELPCIEYAIAHKVKVINASFGSTTPNQPEMDAIYEAGKAGIIFVCAAGNADEDADITGFYPANYPLDNIICVGATDNRDLQAFFSNYGSGSVDLFAPGQYIYSTYNSNTSAYAYLDGTSMAAPFVTGTVALLRAQYPNDTYREIINRILNGVDKKASLAGKAQTGGRLNLATSLASAPNTAPNALFANRTSLGGYDPYTRSNNADTPAALEAGTPAIAGGAGSHSLWWSWTAPENASVEIDTSGTKGGQVLTGGSTYATLLGVYTGSSLGSLSPIGTPVTGLTEPLEGGGGNVPYSEVKFEAAAGTSYQINVEGQNGASGQTVLAINTFPDNDSVSLPRVLSGRSASLGDANINATRVSGEPNIGNYAGGHSLWYSWTAPYTGNAQVSAYSYDFVTDIGVYTGAGLGNLTQAGSAGLAGQIFGTSTPAANAVATFAATAGTTYLIEVDGRSSTDIGDFIVNLDDSLWQGVTHDAVTCSPAVGPDGTLYVGSNDDTFYAYSPTGTLLWSKSGSGVFDTNSPAVGPDGTVYASCSDGNLYAYNGKTGGSVWTFPFPNSQIPSSSASLGSDGTLYVHGTDGTNGDLYALSPNGTQKWAFSAAGQSYAAPTLGSDGTIYLGTDEGHFYAVNPDGTQKWVFSTPVAGESIYTAAALDLQGNLYFGTLAGNFYSVTPAGALRWSYAIGNNITSAPAIANGAVYFGGYDGYLYSLSTSGSLNWRFALGNQVRASGPAVDANGVVYVGCYDHNVYAVSASGALVRTYATADIIRSSPLLSGGSLYFGSNDHKLYAFSLPAGLAAADWPMYQHDPQRTGRAGSNALVITTQPSSQAVAIGAPFTLTVAATGPVTPTYQWYLGGSPIAGATSATYSVASATTANAGTYTVVVTAGAATATSAAASVTVSAGTAGHLVNLSARASVGTGSNILIAGFVIGGSGDKTMLLRGIGPTLASAPFSISGALQKPQLTLVNTSNGSTVYSGTAWGGGADLTAAFTQTGAFSLPATSADAAILQTLPAGAYTSEVAGVNATTGVALAEIYDTQPNSTGASLLNISARAAVGTGANVLIAGFVIEGSLPAQVLLRGIGPTLGAAPFNITGALAQPQIQLFNSSGTVIQSNSVWGGTTALQNAFSQVGAFALPAGSADAAMVATLPAGAYTLQLSGVNGTTGVGLIEVYLIR